MTQRPTFAAQTNPGTRRGASNLVGELSLEQRVTALEAMLGQSPQFATGSITVSSGTGNESFTGVGFKPRLLILFGTVFAASASVATFVWGASTTDGSRSSAIRVDSTDGQRTQQGTAYTVLDDNDSVIDAEGTLVSFDDDGFTLSRDVSAGTSLTLYYVAMS